MLVSLEKLQVAAALQGGERHEQRAVVVDRRLAHLRERVYWVVHIAVTQQECSEASLKRLDAIVGVGWLKAVEL